MSLLDRISMPPEHKVRLQEASALNAACDRIAAVFPGVGGGTVDDIAAIVARVEKALTDWSWDHVKDGDIATVIIARFSGRASVSPKLSKFLLEEIMVSSRANLLAALCQAYLDGWKAGHTETKIVAELILKRGTDLPSRWMNVFHICPEILDPTEGANKIGAKLAGFSDPYKGLISIGIAAPHGPGFMYAAHFAFLNALSAPRSIAAAQKILDWIAPIHEQRLEGERGAAAVRKVLDPWRNEQCPDDLREYCTKRITDLYGDPRKDRQDFWASVGEDHKRVLLKWLAGKSMEAIFEIVSRAEDLSGDRDQWNKRKRFWMGQYNKGLIDEAWVALGPDARRIADRLYKDTGDVSYRSYGRQDSRRDTSLLFMKIGTKVIVEGSHSFRVHVFPNRERPTPNLYMQSYDLDDIILPYPHDDARVHDTGDNWMYWVQRRLR